MIDGNVVRTASDAFLDWVDAGIEEHSGSNGGTRSRVWGQLRIGVGAGGDASRRRYELRHVDDAETAVEKLESHEDPLDAREVAKFDDRGRYRPLKTAPTLATGWVFPALDPEELLDAVDFVYPATVVNWYLEHECDLDVTHWHESADRQTGIYDVVDELPPEAVEWATEACCVDSQCLKRRQWDYDDHRELDVPRGTGEFPCREPCSLLIAAARKWALVEREDEHTCELELTPSEREQIEAIVDAVAEGRIDEIREADFDDPANRYRVRYLRAKRFGRKTDDDPADG